jgi:hypothetical protein
MSSRIHEVDANVVQLGLGAIAGANAVERPPNEAECLVEGVVKRAAHMAQRDNSPIAHRIEATNATAMTSQNFARSRWTGRIAAVVASPPSSTAHVHSPIVAT